MSNNEKLYSPGDKKEKEGRERNAGQLPIPVVRGGTFVVCVCAGATTTASTSSFLSGFPETFFLKAQSTL